MIINLNAPLLEVARRLVKNCIFDPAADAVGDDDTTGEAADMMRRSAAVLDSLGWPGSAQRSATLTDEDAALVRMAALATLGAAGEALDEATILAGRDHAEWDADAAVHDLEECIAVLDVVGWPPGSTRARTPQASAREGDGDLEVAALVDGLPLPAWLIDASLRIVTRNLAAERLGMPAAPGTELADAVAAADRERVGQALTAARAEQRSIELHVHLVTARGPEAHRVSCTPRFSSDGALVGYVAVAVQEPRTGRD
ncbi:MAG: PAS domain-containing protein [Thermoleophilia bacterium]